jgi:GMP synthase-like glutamine amidotransferase
VRSVLVRQHLDTAPPARLIGWLEARGLPYVVDRVWLRGTDPDPADHAFVVSLGHSRGSRDTHDPVVAAEHGLIARAVEQDVPVLGLCYGGQVLAEVLGGTVERAAVPELGWLGEIETDDAEQVPSGPWLSWHFDSWTVPADATELARTPAASQAFRLGPHLAVQFHPEATIPVVQDWARSDGVAADLDAPPERIAAAHDAAYRLFDAFANHLQKRLALEAS